MTRFLLCLSVILAVGLLAPAPSWSDPHERPVYDIPEYENSGDDDEPEIQGPVILQPSLGRHAEAAPAPAPPQAREEKALALPQWLSNFFDRIPTFRGRHYEMLR